MKTEIINVIKVLAVLAFFGVAAFGLMFLFLRIFDMIKVPGLPEGWKAVSYRVPVNGENFFYDGKICNDKNQRHEYLIVEKIQPRRIVLEETEEKHLGCQTLYIDDTEFMIMTNKIWREVKETDITFTNNEPKLSLSVIELKDISSNAKYITDKIAAFVKDK